MEPNPNNPLAEKRASRTLLKGLILIVAISLFLVMMTSLGQVLFPDIGSSTKQDDATLDTQSICYACQEYHKREGKWPSSLQILNAYLEKNSLLDPWGHEYKLEFRKNQETDEDEPVIWTVDNKGKRIQWPRQ